MNAKELKSILESVDEDAEIIVVVYTKDGYESGYIDRVDPNCRYNSVTKQKLNDDEKVVEITTSTKVIK